MPGGSLHLKDRRGWLLAWSLIFWASTLPAQDLVVQDIQIWGAERTRAWVILRELTLAEGDTLAAADLPGRLARSEQNLYNLGLFNDVKLEVNQTGTLLWILVVLRERWYLFGAPTLDLEERNAYDLLGALQARDLRRLVYGLSLDWRNLTGRNETLSFFGQLGFSQRLRLDWQQPAAWRRHNLDLYLGLAISREGEIIAGVDQGAVQWRSLEDEPMRRRYRGYVGLGKRLDPYRQAYAEVGYRHERYADSLLRLALRGESLGFVPDGGAVVAYPSLAAGYVADHRDLRSFPLRGHKLHLFARAALPGGSGGVTFVQGGGSWAHHLPLGGRWYAAYGVQQITTLGRQVPWFARTFVGISESPFRGVSTELRGYEPYALAATWLSLAKAEVKYALLHRRILHLDWIPYRRFQDLPVGLYLSAFGEMAYARDDSYAAQDPFLLDQLLRGYGVGLNLIGFYDMLLRIEYSRNHLGGQGVYFHGTVPIK